MIRNGLKLGKLKILRSESLSENFGETFFKQKGIGCPTKSFTALIEMLPYLTENMLWKKYPSRFWKHYLNYFWNFIAKNSSFNTTICCIAKIWAKILLFYNASKYCCLKNILFRNSKSGYFSRRNIMKVSSKYSKGLSKNLEKVIHFGNFLFW